jgi:hypothetical protein
MSGWDSNDLRAKSLLGHTALPEIQSGNIAKEISALLQWNKSLLMPPLQASQSRNTMVIHNSFSM